MPITPAKLATRQKPVTFEYLGDPVNVSYFPAAFNSDIGAELKAWVERLQPRDKSDVSEEEARALLREFGAWFCALVASWDYCEDDGVTPQALTPENIATQLVAFPDFILAVLLAIVNDRNQGNANGTTPSNTSDATSSPTGNSTSSPMALSRNPLESSSRRGGSKRRQPLNG